MGSGMMEEKLGGKHAFGLTWPVCTNLWTAWKNAAYVLRCWLLTSNHLGLVLKLPTL